MTPVTAVISTHNRRDELLATLAGLRNLALPDLRVVVVDNASSDGSADRVRRDFPSVTLLPHSDNAPMRGYNLGFAAVQTPFALALDDDSCPRPGAIERMVGRLEEFPGAGAIAANIVGRDGNSEWGPEGNVDFSSAWFNLIGCGFLVRREVLVQTGGFDEDFGLYYNDLEFALRILAFGRCILFDRLAVVDHRCVRSPASPLKHRLMLRNFPLLLRSHFSGWRRLDLELGHLAAALWRAARDRRLAPALRGIAQSFRARSSRPFLPAPETAPGVRRFVHRYSFAKTILRRPPPSGQEPGPGFSASIPPPPLRRAAPPKPSLPSCAWESRFRAHPAETLRDALSSPPPPGVCGCAARLADFASPWPDYQWHLAHRCFLSCAEREARSRVASAWPWRPLVSILLPVFKTHPPHLAECLLSVERQIYPHWQLCAVDDGSASPALRRILEDFAARHPGKTRLAFRPDNRGIARSSQEALDLASGDFVALLDHDDRLAPEALWEAVRLLNQNPSLDWIYSDYDKIAPDGQRLAYHFKPDWSPDLLLSYCYCVHLSVLRRSLVVEAGGFRDEFNGAQDYDLVLRLAEFSPRVAHVPRVLYSWRQSDSSTASNPASKPYSFVAGQRAVADALLRRNDPGSCVYLKDSGLWDGVHRVLRPAFLPDVDLVLLPEAIPPGTDLPPWLDGQRGIRVADRFFLRPGEAPGTLLGRALRQGTAPYLLVVGSPLSPNGPDVVHDVVAHLSVPRVAAAAPKFLRPDGAVDHVGLSWEPGGRLFQPLRGLPGHLPGYGAYAVVARNVAAVSTALAAFHADALRQSGGFETALGPHGAILGACLNLRRAGFRIVADGGPSAQLLSAPFDPGPDLAPGGPDHHALVQRHPSLFVSGDPFYNPNLRAAPPDFGVWHDPA